MAYRFYLAPVAVLAVLLLSVASAFAQLRGFAQGDRYILTFQNVSATPERWTVLIACPPGTADVEEVLGSATQIDFDSFQVEPLEFGNSVQAVVSLTGCDPNDFRIAVYSEDGSEIYTASVDEGTVELVPELAEEFQQFGVVEGDYSDFNLDDYFAIEDQGAVGGFIDSVIGALTPAPAASYPPIPPGNPVMTTQDLAYINGVPAPRFSQFVLPYGGEEGTTVVVNQYGQLLNNQGQVVNSMGQPVTDAAGRAVVNLDRDAAFRATQDVSLYGGGSFGSSPTGGGSVGGSGFGTSFSASSGLGGSYSGQSQFGAGGRLVAGGFQAGQGFVQYNTGSGNIDPSAGATAARRAASQQQIQQTLSGAGYGQYGGVGGVTGPVFGGGRR